MGYSYIFPGKTFCLNCTCFLRSEYHCSIQEHCFDWLIQEDCSNKAVFWLADTRRLYQPGSVVISWYKKIAANRAVFWLVDTGRLQQTWQCFDWLIQEDCSNQPVFLLVDTGRLQQTWQCLIVWHRKIAATRQCYDWLYGDRKICLSYLYYSFQDSHIVLNHSTTINGTEQAI